MQSQFLVIVPGDNRVLTWGYIFKEENNQGPGDVSMTGTKEEKNTIIE